MNDESYMFGFVVVLFNPDLVFLRNLVDKILSKETYVVLVDNSDDVNPLDYIESDRVKYITNDSNKGIAEAQNIGVNEVLSKGCKYVTFLDQDSSVDNLFIYKMKKLLLEDDSKIYSPLHYNNFSGCLYNIITLSKYGVIKTDPNFRKDDYFYSNYVISSGMTLKVSSFFDIGFYDSNLFIDYVDTEWCLRASNMGYDFISTRSIIFKHEIGIGERKILNYTLPIHSPVRRYYRLRNSILLLSKQHVSKFYLIREIITNFIQNLLLAYYEKKNRKGYIQSTINALKDGIKSVIGNKND